MYNNLYPPLWVLNVVKSEVGSSKFMGKFVKGKGFVVLTEDYSVKVLGIQPYMQASV